MGDNHAPQLIWRSFVKLGRPERARMAVAVSGRTVAWWAWEPTPAVHVVDAATGAELHRETCSPLRLFPAAADGFIGLDEGWRTRDRPRTTAQLVAFMRVRDRVDIERRDVPDDTHLIGVHPSDDRLLLWRDGRAELRAWREQDLVATWLLRFSPGVDWDAGCVWGVVDNGGRELVFSALDDAWSHSVVSSQSWRVEGVGCGVLRSGFQGVCLFRPAGRPLTVLPPTSRTIWNVVVTDCGRTVRLMLGRKPRRFEIDLEAGHVLLSPTDALHLARARRHHTGSDLAWHPTLDMVALIRQWPRTAVYDAGGGFLCRLPDGSRPQAWLPSTTAVLTISEGDHETALLERWDIPVSTLANVVRPAL